MTRRQRQRQLYAWLVLTVLTVTIGAAALINRQQRPIQAPPAVAAAAQTPDAEVAE